MTDRRKTRTELEHDPAEAAAEATAGAPLSREVRYLPPPVPARDTPPQARTPFLAAFFSLFPGLGNVYNGLYLRGITFFLIIIGLITLAQETRPPETVLLIFAVIFVWLFSIFDAYRQATLINFGYAPDLEMPDRPRFSGWGSGGLTAGIAVFLLGFYGFLRELDIDLRPLGEYWYVLFMIFGGFLIVWTVIQRKKAGEGAADAGLALEDE